ncbi:MAG TPA: glycosyltransferase family 2 protein [Pseudolabrys sp.]|nr:glycosyltransferase family 2 protein [Pseudolabrys sp.]
MRHLLPAEVLAAAERRAATVGVGAERVLIAAGAITAEAYLRALAARLGKQFDTLDGASRAHCPLNDAQLVDALSKGFLPLTSGGRLSIVVAPRNVRRLLEVMRSNPALAERLRFTTEERLCGFAFKPGNGAVENHAVNALQLRWPMLSALRGRGINAFAAIVAGAAIVAVALAPAAAKLCFELSLAACFLAWIALRLVGAFARPPRIKPPARCHDDELPAYTIVSALYDEASSVNELLASFERLDYPPEKLQILLVTERDDPDTRTAIAAYRGRLAVETIVAPATGPRTKPKALNVALPLARGAFTVVFDAEDRPEPDQLRRAFDAFRKAGGRLACVQARLTINNASRGWLAAMFAAEYAGHFDVFLPALSALRLPFPLGGSSNHFRTAMLRAVGGWDPYNVTEDADLGMRLARFGYRAEVIESTTFEEAPARLWPWLKQRTRWFKGWMQTWFVHMREPRRLLRELGPIHFVSFQLLVGGTVLAALVHAVFLGILIQAVMDDVPMWKGDGLAVVVLTSLYGATAASGYLTSAFLGWRGLARRRLLSASWVLALMPVHWLLLSLAAWRALYQFLANPYRWEKTAHGAAAETQSAMNVLRPLSLAEQGRIGHAASLVPAQSANAS